MKKKIIEILLKNSEILKVKGSIMIDSEEEEWLWSGEFDKVADKIVKLLDLHRVNVPKGTFCAYVPF